MPVWMTYLGESRRASASLLGAFLIMTTVMVTMFTIQVSDLYIVQLKVQRAADLATLAATVGATAPVVSSGGVANASAAATALNVASINGFGGSTVTTAGGLSGGTPTLTTTISNTPSPIMGSWMGAASPVVAAPAQALMTPVVVPDCIAALGGAFQISGTAAVSAPGCGVASQSTIAMSGGLFTASAVAVGVHAYDEIPLVIGGSQSPGTGAFMYNALTSDIVGNNPSITALQTHLASLASWPYGSTIPETVTTYGVISGTAQSYGPAMVTVTVLPNTHWGTLTLLGNATLNFAGSGGADNTCANPTTVWGATQLSGSNTLNFASGCYIFNGSVSTALGSSTSININAGARVVFCLQNTLNMTLGGSLTIGNADQYSFGGNVNVGNNGILSVGNGKKLFSGNIIINNSSGTLSFGNGTSYLNGTTISGGTGSGNLTFGNGPFYIWNGTISNPGYANIKFGTGPFYFYNTIINDGTFGQGQIDFAGGDYYFYGGSINSGQNVFAKIQFNVGNMDLYNSASISVNSPIRLGNPFVPSGNATVSLYGGSVTINTGGNLSLLGSTLAMTTGTLTVSGGTFYSSPPTNATPNYGYTNIALLSTGGAINFTGGTSNVGGLIYAPNSAVTVSGNAILKQNSSYCLSLVASAVTLSGSSSTTLSPCAGLSAASTGTNSMLNQ